MRRWPSGVMQFLTPGGMAGGSSGRSDSSSVSLTKALLTRSPCPPNAHDLPHEWRRYGSSAYGSSQRNRESAKRSAASQEARRDGCGKATEISSLGKHMIGARTDPYQ